MEKARGAAVQKVELRKESSAAVLAEIEQYVREVLGQEAVARLAAPDGGIYIGKMIWEDPDHIVQRLSGTRAIAHQKKLLTKTPAIGDVVRIEYSCGRASVKEINS